MLINKRVHGYSIHKKYVVGGGFLDSVSSVFSSVKSSILLTLSNVGSYLKTNKDLLLKPLIGAVCQLGAKALSEGVPAIINRINQNRRNKIQNVLSQNWGENVLLQNDNFDRIVIEHRKFQELIKNNLIDNVNETYNPSPMSVSNILGSGLKKKIKTASRGSGIKNF